MKLSPWRRQRATSAAPRGERDGSAVPDAPAAACDASRCTGLNRYSTQCRLDAAPGTDRCTFHPRKEQPE